MVRDGPRQWSAIMFELSTKIKTRTIIKDLNSIRNTEKENYHPIIIPTRIKELIINERCILVKCMVTYVGVCNVYNVYVEYLL